jgi:hypothetical protein
VHEKKTLTCMGMEARKIQPWTDIKRRHRWAQIPKGEVKSWKTGRPDSRQVRESESIQGSRVMLLSIGPAAADQRLWGRPTAAPAAPSSHCSAASKAPAKSPRRSQAQ